MISGNGKAIYIVTSKRAIAGIELQYLKWPSSILLSNYFPKKKKKVFYDVCMGNRAATNKDVRKVGVTFNMNTSSDQD